MEERVVKVGLAAYPPLTNPCAVGFKTLLPIKKICPEPGSTTEILGYLLRFLKIKYILVPIFNVSDWGSYPTNHSSGNWTGVLGMLQSGEIDTVSVTYKIMERRHIDFSFASPVIFGSYGFLFQKEYPSVSGSTLLFVFSGIFWMLLTASLAILIGVMIWDAIVHHDGKFHLKVFCCHFTRSLWTVVAFVFNQYPSQISIARRQRLTATRKVVLASLGILTLVTISLYQSSLLSVLMVREELKNFDRTSQLAPLIASGRRTLITEPNNGAAGYFIDVNTSILPYFKLMRSSIEKYGLQRYDSMPEARNELLINQHAVMVVHFVLGMEEAARSCQLKFLEDEDLSGQQDSFIFRKNDTFLQKKISEHIYLNLDMVNRIRNNYDKTEQLYCPPSNQPGRPLGLKNLHVVFLLGLVGHSLGIFQLILENLTKYWRNWKKESLEETAERKETAASGHLRTVSVFSSGSNYSFDEVHSIETVSTDVRSTLRKTTI